MNNVIFTQKDLNPSKGITPELLENQFIFRKTGEFKEPSFVAIAQIKEPIWWNRPLEPESLVQLEQDGMYSYNMPYIGGVASYKNGYNLLLGTYCVPIAIQIKLDPTWSKLKTSHLLGAATGVIVDTLLELGIKEENIGYLHNDLLYNGKKFVAEEGAVRNGVFTENLIVTLRYNPEKALFDRLTGQYAQARGITGILDECDCFTKEEFIELFTKKYKEFIESL